MTVLADGSWAVSVSRRHRGVFGLDLGCFFYLVHHCGAGRSGRAQTGGSEQRRLRAAQEEL